MSNDPSIDQSVGKNGKNMPLDVATIQRLLKTYYFNQSRNFTHQISTPDTKITQSQIKNGIAASKYVTYCNNVVKKNGNSRYSWSYSKSN